jgi:hypothetical protein
LITGSRITGNGIGGSNTRGGIIFAANGGTVNVTNNLIANNAVFGIGLEGGFTGTLGYGSNSFGGNTEDLSSASNLVSMKNNVNAGGVF